MAAFKTVDQLAKAYKDGKLNKAKSKAVVNDDGTVTVSAVPVDKKTKKAVAGALPEVVFTGNVKDLLKLLLKKLGIPVA